MRPSRKYLTSPRRLAHVLAVSGLVLASASTLFAEKIPKEEAGPAVPAAGWRVYLDPETGELTSTPSPEQIETLSEQMRSKRLEPALARSGDGLLPFFLERGGRGVYLEGRFQSSLVVQRRDDGSFAFLCTAGHAGEALAEPPSPATEPWVEK